MTRIVSVLIATALLLGPVIGLELGVRALVEAGRLPQAPSSNAETDVSMANLIRQGKPDVLIIGSSSSRSGVKPTSLESRIWRDTGASVRVQTAAQAGMSLESQRLLISELAKLDLLPRVVITGITPITLTGIFGEDQDWFRRSPLGQSMSGCAGVDLGAGWLDCQLSRVFTAWRWRGRLDDLAAAITDGVPTTLAGRNRLLHENGWLETEPAQREQLQRRTERALELVPEDPTVPQQTVDDFVALIEELRSDGATVIAFELPYLATFEEALEARHPGWADEVGQGYARLEAAAGIDIVNLGSYGGWSSHQSFRDPRHLSGEGAGPFTRQLWNIDGFREPLLEALGLELLEEPGLPGEVPVVTESAD